MSAAELGDLTRDVVGRAPDDVWAALEKADVLTAALPESAGGNGFGLAGHCAVLTELGRAVAVTPYRNAIAVAAEFAARWDAPIGGQRLAAALVEPGNDDQAAPRARAERRDGQWLVTGTKALVPEGMLAEVLIVPTGQGIFAVAAEATRREPQRLTDAVLGSEAAWVDLDDAPGDLITDDAGALPWLLTQHILATCAEQLGVLEGAVQLTARHVREREQFGRPLGAFQAVSQRLSDALIDVRALQVTLAEAITEQTPATVSAAAYWAAEAGHRVAHTCVHLHGGTGIDLDHPAHRHFAAAKRLEFDLGGPTRQLKTLGSLLAT